MPYPAPRTYQENKELLGFQPWYEEIIDLILWNPRIRNEEIAERLSTSQQYICLIRNSDSFRARFAQRRALLSEARTEALVGRLTSVADRSLELISEELDPSRTSSRRPKLERLIDLMDKSLNRLGYGAKTSEVVNNQVVQQVNVGASAAAIAEARKAIQQSQARLLNGPIDPLANDGFDEGEILDLEPQRAEPGPWAEEVSGEVEHPADGGTVGVRPPGGGE